MFQNAQSQCEETDGPYNRCEENNVVSVFMLEDLAKEWNTIPKHSSNTLCPVIQF